MNKVFDDLIRPPLVLKKTNYVYNETKFEKIERVTSYYMNNNKKFIWLKLFNNSYIYGNPFSQYNFN
uniref:Uncharacterized protein n=1 Tax=Florenciella sp. virus SA2 TaxID=3240092 RepID=A0AB39JCF2_9VIRU